MVKLKVSRLCMASTLKKTNKLNQDMQISESEVSHSSGRKNNESSGTENESHKLKSYIKLLENLRRTARIILISELEAAIRNDVALSK